MWAVGKQKEAMDKSSFQGIVIPENICHFQAIMINHKPIIHKQHCNNQDLNDMDVTASKERKGREKLEVY